MRYVLFDEEWGVFLGEAFGLGFWSKLDPVGQDRAPAFESEVSIKEFIGGMVPKGRPKKWWAFPVEASGSPEDGFYASMEACIKAGVPAWDSGLN